MYSSSVPYQPEVRYRLLLPVILAIGSKPLHRLSRVAPAAILMIAKVTVVLL